jgi:CubicO group peptidase (beta-lactamase class C family)
VSATEAGGLVQERDSDQFARFTLTVEATEPHLIVSLDLAAIPRPSEFAIARLTEGEAIAAVQTVLDRAAGQDRFSGTVLVAKDGQVLFSAAYGLADREQGTPNTPRTLFRIGSMNKMFTAVAVLQLVEAGKLELSAPVGDYLTGYSSQDVAAKVTVHHLLTHTAGTGNIFGPEFTAHRQELRELSDYVRLYGDREPEFEPGSQWKYSNYGYILLGALVEKVTGQTYYDYVNARIYQAANMTATGSQPEHEAVADLSTGYTKPPGTTTWVPNTDTLPWRGTSAGGGYSTAQDLARFARALLDHRLLREDSTRLLITGKADIAPGARYAYGFADHRDGEGNGSVGHDGGAPGMNGSLWISPKSGYVVVALANMDPPAAQRIASWLDARLPASGDSAVRR